MNLPCLVAYLHILLPDPVPAVSGCHICAVFSVPKIRVAAGQPAWGHFPWGAIKSMSLQLQGTHCHLSSKTQQGKIGTYHCFRASICAVLLETTWTGEDGKQHPGSCVSWSFILFNSYCAEEIPEKFSVWFGPSVSGQCFLSRCEEQLWHSFSARFSLFFWDCIEAQWLSNRYTF